MWFLSVLGGKAKKLVLEWVYFSRTATISVLFNANVAANYTPIQFRCADLPINASKTKKYIRLDSIF